jgi:hypothetical protein
MFGAGTNEQDSETDAFASSASRNRQGAVRRRGPRARAGGPHARGQPRQRHDLHHRPAGAGGRPDLDEQVDPTEWNDYIRKSQDSLRVIADLTGGIAVVNQNDFDKR